MVFMAMWSDYHDHMREFPVQPLAGVGVVVLRPGVEGELEVLLVRRGRPPLEGRWSVPGGLIELGETARAAAAREVREETGLDVEVGEAFAQVDRIERAPDGRVRYHYVLTEFPARPRSAGMGIRGPHVGASTSGTRGARVPALLQPGPAAALGPAPINAGSDAREARWVPWSALAEYPLTPGLEAILSKARMLY
jgi:ADP-ribose pyrophosphatase YjhB (NUDIX family)